MSESEIQILHTVKFNAENFIHIKNFESLVMDESFKWTKESE